jgi:beta-lactamase class D
MNSQPLIKLIFFFLFAVSFTNTLSAKEENFLLVKGVTNEIVVELGPSINERISPCSTFKIILSLMGYDAGILKDEKTPIWDFQDGYDDWLESWKAPQSPQSWMKYSCVWYSKILALQLGMEKFKTI